ncbi:MAG: MFS transporter [Clostridiales bacterium]|nr:MFS transporter [Clostridiales bacterium]
MSKDSNFGKFLLLWAGEFISAIGGGLTSFGLGVYVYKQTGSAACTSLVTLLAFFPMLVLSVPAGILADRYDRRTLMMLGDGLSAIGLIYILIRMFMGGATLLDICIGVTISSVFSALLEPSYKATVTDMLTKEEYSKANGLVSIAGSARYLLSPIIAGFLLAISDIKLLLIIDICTFFLTVITTAVVRRGIESKKSDENVSLKNGIKEGFAVIRAKKGIMTLIIMTSVITCFIGIMMTLSEPMVLAFRDEKTLGTLETICASGMLVTSVVLGALGIKKHFVKLLSFSLALSGIGMTVFGIKENVILMTVAGFFFFAMLPIANNSLDYLIRINIPEETQGRAWGIIGFISQLGYVVAFAASGVLADVTAKVMNISVGRGSGMVIMVAGILLTVVSLFLLFRKNIRNLEKAGK